MAIILSREETDRLNMTRPSAAAEAEIKAALENLKKTLKKHRCTAFIETVCGELSVFKVPKGKTFVVRDRDEKQPAGSQFCRGVYLSTGYQPYNAEHEIIYQI
jgi:hypothetical protein